MMNMTETADDGAMNHHMMMQGAIPNSNDHDDEESGGDGGSCSTDNEGSVTNLKERAAKETKRTLARSETRAGTLRLAV
jgi:hypothetical protein